MPIFNAELVREAYDIVEPSILSVIQRKVTSRSAVAIVVAATRAIRPWSDVAGNRFADTCLLVTSIGNLDDSPYPNMAIALSKAEISARTGMPTASLPAQYLQAGDTVFWGSAVLDGIVVACAGLEEHHDEMFSYWIAATVQALAKQRYAEWKARHPEASFL